VTAVLVTGAAGFVGGHLVDLLNGSGVAVTGWHRPGSGRGEPSQRGRATQVHWQAVDLLDRQAVAGALADMRPAVVFHCAAAAHVAQSWGSAQATLKTNVLGTHHLLAGLRAAGVSARVLIPGTAYVYRPSERALSESDPIAPRSPYALSKLAQEMVGLRSIEEDGQQVFVTRSFNHIGARQEPSYAAPGFAKQIALIEAGRMPPTIDVGNLDAARDLTDVRDVVGAYRGIVEHGRPGVIYNVCSGRAWKIREILDRLVAMSRVPVSVRVDPARYRPNDMPVLLGDPGRLAEATGWKPVISIDQMLSDLLEYWRKEIE
jgi:GDP-4-dehydro-6-deoxy-D-mannose reductase